MADTDELEMIASEGDWLDLKTGESAIVRGKLATAVPADASGMLVRQPDWSEIAIDLPQGAEKEIARGARVQVVVTRTEDGLEASGADITVTENEA